MPKPDCNIHRSPHDETTPYVCLNRAIAQDAKLSFAARGMMTYILSKPDDWNITLEDLTNNNPAGRDATRKVFYELIANGYLVPGTQQRKAGRFTTATPHQCYESPCTDRYTR